MQEMAGKAVRAVIHRTAESEGIGPGQAPAPATAAIEPQPTQEAAPPAERLVAPEQAAAPGQISEVPEAPPEPEGRGLIGTFPGGKVVDSAAADRIQIFFPGKPSESVRAELKRNGFRWAPSIQAWQAYRKDRYRQAALRITRAQSPAAAGPPPVETREERGAAGPTGTGVRWNALTSEGRYTLMTDAGLDPDTANSIAKSDYQSLSPEHRKIVDGQFEQLPEPEKPKRPKIFGPGKKAAEAKKQEPEEKPEREWPYGVKKGDRLLYMGEPVDVVGYESFTMAPALPLGPRGQFVAGPWGGEKHEVFTVRDGLGNEQPALPSELARETGEPLVPQEEAAPAETKAAPTPQPSAKTYTEADKNADIKLIQKLLKQQEEGGGTPGFRAERRETIGERPADPLVQALQRVGTYYYEQEGITDEPLWRMSMQSDIGDAVGPYLNGLWQRVSGEPLAKPSRIEDTEAREGTSHGTPIREGSAGVQGLGGEVPEAPEEVGAGRVPGVRPSGGPEGALPEPREVSAGGAAAPSGAGFEPPGSRTSGYEALDLPTESGRGGEGSERRPLSILPNGNIHIEDPALIAGGESLPKQFENNLAALRTLAQIRREGRSTATPEEKETLVRTVGWGGALRDYAFKDVGWDKRDSKRGKLQTELGRLLTRKEYERAKASSLNANYTSPEVVQGMWDVVRLMGFEGGQLLEPAGGVFHFFGLMPLQVMRRSQLSGFELEPMTGEMGKLLYPAADIKVMGFQESSKGGRYPLPVSFFDLVITNVPFWEHSINDPPYNKYNLNLHNYFIVKSLDLLRPGGITAPATHSA